MAIKIGDINGSATTTLAQNNDRDLNGNWQIFLEDAKMKPGEIYHLPLSTPDLNQVEGFQFTLDYDPQVLEIISVENGVLVDDNIGKHLRNRGMLTVSWQRNEQHTFEEKLFGLVVRSTKKAKLSELLQLGSRFTPAEAYNFDNEDELINIELQYFERAGSGLELYQNIPNPVTAQTIIPFNLPKDGAIIMEIHNAKGQRVLTIKDHFEAGSNEVRISRGQLEKGIYFYTLRFSGQQLSRKMIITQ